MLNYVEMIDSKIKGESKKEILDEKRLELEEYFKEIVKNNMNDVLSQNLVGKQLNDI